MKLAHSFHKVAHQVVVLVRAGDSAHEALHAHEAEAEVHHKFNVYNPMLQYVGSRFMYAWLTSTLTIIEQNSMS